jgi:hypothetical protein
MSIKKVLALVFIHLVVAKGLSASLTYSPPAPKTGETVTFTLSPSGSPAGAISWNFGDNSPVQSSPSLTVTHVYAAVGSYTASASYFTISHADVDQATVVVTNPRQISFSPLQPKAGQAVAFTALSFYSSCIRWDFGDATIKNGAAAESHTYANAGNYSVRAYEECGTIYGTTVTLSVAETEVTPPPVTPNKPTLAVTFVSLYFAGGKADISVAKDFAGLQAFADIQVTGTGILQWQWLVDGMVVKSDTLAVSFDNKFTLDSGKVPGLPTSIPGRHLVTLHFQNPIIDFAIPVISYFVALRGPAPVIRRVTPATLAPGAEYNLELEGADLTPGTEISFPAPLALLKKAIILSSTQARATVFVPPTTGNGAKAVTARNEYGQSNGPGQVTITSPEQVLSSKPPDVKPYPGLNPPPESKASFEQFKEQLGKTPAITGAIIYFPYFSPSFADIQFFLKRGWQSLTGAIIKVDGVTIPEDQYIRGMYRAQPAMKLARGHVFKVSVRFEDITYTGHGGKIDTFVQLTQPAKDKTLCLSKTPHFDCRWTFSNGMAEVQLYAWFLGQPQNEFFFWSLTADHFLIRTEGIHSTQGKLYIFLRKQYSNIHFDGLADLASGIQVLQGAPSPARVLDLANADCGNASLPKMKGAAPTEAKAAQPADASIGLMYSTIPQLNGRITYNLNSDPDSPVTVSSSFDFSKEGIPITDAVIKVDGILIPPIPDTVFYAKEGPWPINIAAGHVTTISVTADGTTYTGSGGLIDSIPQLIVPAEGTAISLMHTPYINFQWTGANGISPILLRVYFQSGGENKELCTSWVTADHKQVYLNTLPRGSSGVLDVSLLKTYDHLVMDGMMRTTSAPAVMVFRSFYLKLVP